MYYNTKGGARIRELRIAKNFTQDDLAEHMNVSHGYISFIESGKRGCSVDVLIALSNLFGVSIDYIVLGTVTYGWLLLYLFLASIVGQFGDLAMSTIKRTVGIKDFSRILPGHGGILDRFDSFLFAAPFAVLYGNMTGCFL
ncbi:MAG: phosphatidate cytidylyltransferase [Oscillospiraceae bacterium]|nr:phosphatidate cytidylyltransferase [Oscillospiraceae bacterium]